MTLKDNGKVAVECVLSTRAYVGRDVENVIAGIQCTDCLFSRVEWSIQKEKIFSGTILVMRSVVM